MEGDQEEYAEKEQFVTDAYLERQKQLEELERHQQDTKEETAEGGPITDMTTFYRQVLDNATADPSAHIESSDLNKSELSKRKQEEEREAARIKDAIAAGILVSNKISFLML